MKRCTVRLGLSLMLAMGWWVQRLPAQAPAAPAPLAPVQAPCCGQAAEGAPNGTNNSRGVLHRLLNKHGLACEATHDGATCGSLYSEYMFFFGSCRQYFGEPCIVRPRPVMTPAYGGYNQ